MALIVNNEKIEDSVIQREVERLRADYQRVFNDQTPEQQQAQLFEWSRENVIERVLINQEAKKPDYEVPIAEVEAAFAQLKKQYKAQQLYEKFDCENDEGIKQKIELELRVRGMVRELCKDVPEPSKDAVLKFYDANKEQFTSAEQVRVAHIVKHINWQSDETTACGVVTKALDELTNGAVFETLASKYSDCPENGGDMGYITKGQMVEEFEDVVFNLGVGEVSGVFRTRYGFHIAKLYDRKPAVVRSLKEATSQVEMLLQEQMRGGIIDEFVDRLKDKAEIEEV